MEWDETIDLGYESLIGGATANMSRRWNYHMRYQIDRKIGSLINFLIIQSHYSFIHFYCSLKKIVLRL